MNYHAEFLEARQTLELSARTAAQFLAQLGALAPVLLPPFPAATLGRRPSFQATVLDQKYWFAKLYEFVSYEELQYSTQTKYPAFSLHFMKVFYGMYYTALQKYLSQNFGGISPLWLIHFDGPSEPTEPASKEAVMFSVRTGATAHILGDMPQALVSAFNSWNANPKPAFKDLREDFIDKSKIAFTRAQARFYIDVNDKTVSPFKPEVGQFGAALVQQAFNIQPSLTVMFQWRRDAWDKAASRL